MTGNTYLTTHIIHNAISWSDTVLTNRLAVFVSLNNYSDNIKQWEHDACSKFTEAVLKAISDMDDTRKGYRFVDGMIFVEKFLCEYTEVKVYKFESAFTEFCNRYKDEVYFYISEV